MGNSHAACTKAVAAIEGYRKTFRQAYGDPEPTIDRIADAIAAYEATLFSGNSAWDRYQNIDGKTCRPVGTTVVCR